MFHPGCCTLTLGQLSATEVVGLCVETGLTHVEWWGRDQGHVPMGNVERAIEVRKITEASNLTISSYGSYYRVGESEKEGLSFNSVLDTACALETPLIRVWAGTKGSQDCSEADRAALIEDSLRIADCCAKNDVAIAFEYHIGTLTDTNESTMDLMKATEHPAITFGWQSRTGVEMSYDLAGLEDVLPKLSTLHVYNWSLNENGKYDRHPLSEGKSQWEQYLKLASKTGRDHVALIEFVKDNTVEQFKDDAKALISFLK